MKYQSSSDAMSSFKLVLISTSVLSAAIVLKFSAPAITDFAKCLPSIYYGVVSWLRPPYLYLVINFIIITIAASSKLQSGKDNGGSSSAAQQPLDAASTVGLPESSADRSISVSYPTAEYKYDGVDSSGYEVETGQGPELDSFEHADAKDEPSPFVFAGVEDASAVARDATSNKENEFVVAKSTWTISENRCPAENSPSSVKPPVLARFSHRRNGKTNSEGVKTVLGMSRPNRQDTLENTWRTIPEGRPTPITRHLTKSDTWERDTHHGGRQLPEKIPPLKTMKKAETFNIRSPNPGSSSSGGSSKLRQDESLNHDELNRRVEAFIKKFNEEMRLQRQESLNQYREMINGGVR